MSLQRPTPPRIHPRRRAIDRAVARSLGCDESLVHLFPRLFAGVGALGSMPRSAALWLRDRAGVGPRDTVIELACGKGTAAVAIARATGCRVVGVDAYEPFILEARERARRAGLEDRCTFECAEVRAWTTAHAAGPRHAGATKAAVMLGLFPLTRSVPLLATLLPPGGWCLADDAMDLSDDPEPGALTPTRVTATFAKAGLVPRAARVLTPSQVRRLGERTLGLLERTVAELVREFPAHRVALRHVLADHREASVLLQGDLRPALWLSQRPLPSPTSNAIRPQDPQSSRKPTARPA